MIPAAPNTYLLDDKFEIDALVVAWKRDGVTPVPNPPTATYILLPDGKVKENGAAIFYPHLAVLKFPFTVYVRNWASDKAQDFAEQQHFDLHRWHSDALVDRELKFWEDEGVPEAFALRDLFEKYKRNVGLS